MVWNESDTLQLRRLSASREQKPAATRGPATAARRRASRRLRCVAPLATNRAKLSETFFCYLIRDPQSSGICEANWS